VIGVGEFVGSSAPRFWSAALRAEPPSLIAFLDSFLAHCPRMWAPPERAALARRPRVAELRSTAARLFARLATREPPISETRFAKELVIDHAVFTAPKLISACSVFAGDEAVMGVAARLLDTQEEIGRLLAEDVARAAPAISRAIAVDIAAAVRTEDGATKQAEFLLDAAASLSSFLRVHPPSSAAFLRAGVLESIAKCYSAVPRLKELDGPEETLTHAARCLLACASTVLGSDAMFGALSSDSSSSDSAKLAAAAASIMQFLSSVLESSSQLFTDLARMCSLGSRLAAAMAAHPTLFEKEITTYTIMLLQDKSGERIAAPKRPPSSEKSKQKADASTAVAEGS
jgi:hypothetical protein